MKLFIFVVLESSIHLYIGKCGIYIKKGTAKSGRKGETLCYIKT